MVWIIGLQEGEEIMQYYPNRLRVGIAIMILSIPIGLLLGYLWPPLFEIGVVCTFIMGVIVAINCVNIEGDNCYRRI